MHFCCLAFLSLPSKLSIFCALCSMCVCVCVIEGRVVSPRRQRAFWALPYPASFLKKHMVGIAFCLLSQASVDEMCMTWYQLHSALQVSGSELENTTTTMMSWTNREVMIFCFGILLLEASLWHLEIFSPGIPFLGRPLMVMCLYTFWWKAGGSDRATGSPSVLLGGEESLF